MRVSTGIQGLDHILRDGLLPGRAYLVHGDPGTGKTTLGLHFLGAGTAKGERCLLITFGQAEEHIRSDAKTLGLNIDAVSILDLTPSPDIFTEMQTYDIFSPAEVEREPMTLEVSKTIREKDPVRIFVDSFAHFKQLVRDPFHQRRLAQSFFRFATQRGATLIVSSDDEHECGQDVDGIIHLESGHEGRTVRVTKFRGSDFRAGHYPMRLTDQGFEIPSSAA